MRMVPGNEGQDSRHVHQDSSGDTQVTVKWIHMVHHPNGLEMIVGNVAQARMKSALAEHQRFLTTE